MENFTESARQALALADDAARTRNHNFLGPEHLLLGLVAEADGPAAGVLQRLGVNPAEVRQCIDTIIGIGEAIGDSTITGPLPMTPGAKRVVELAADEAKRMHLQHVDALQLLVGMVRWPNSIGAGVLQELHVDLESLRRVAAESESERARSSGLVDDAPSAAAVPAALPEFGPAMGPKTNVVTCRLDDETLDALDALVAAGIRTTRSDAAAWLIRIGLEANRPLLQRVSATVAEIRRLRLEAQSLARQAEEDDTL